MRDSESQAWQEILVDINEKEDRLAFFRSKAKTLANQYIEKDPCFSSLEAAEISPKSGVIMETICERITEHGGAALIADYGYAQEDQVKIRDTFRAFKNHKLADPLQEVGLADLTADVDFDYLKRKCGDFTLSYGPVTQQQFLLQLGIQIRCNLLKDNNPDLSEELEQSLDMLINPDKMGSRFKFFCVFPKTMEKIHSEHPPVGFYPNKET